MAEEKIAKYLRKGYYGDRHEAGLDYYVGPWDKTHGHGEQNPPDTDETKPEMFGNPEKGGDS